MHVVVVWFPDIDTLQYSLRQTMTIIIVLFLDVIYLMWVFRKTVYLFTRELNTKPDKWIVQKNIRTQIYSLSLSSVFFGSKNVMPAMYLKGLTYCFCKTTEKGNTWAQIVNERWLLFLREFHLFLRHLQGFFFQ